MIRKGVVATVLALGFVLSTCTGAHAAPTEPAPPSGGVVTVPMQFAGFDVAVANANGFEIVTASDGTQSSVPVTDEAKKIRAEADARAVGAGGVGGRDGVVTNSIVYGNCGYSYVWAEKQSGDLLITNTGYGVPMDVYARNWSLIITSSWSGGGAYSFPVSGSGPTWDINHYAKVVGFGNVSASGSTVLVDGTTCYSGNPNASFP